MRRLAFVTAALVWGCGTPPTPVPGEDLIGRPPPASEDPFFFVAMEKAIPVETSGRVESVKPDPEDIKDAAEPAPSLSPDEFEERGRILQEREKQIVMAELQIAEERQRLQEMERRLTESAEQAAVAVKRREKELDEREVFIREDFDRLGQERAALTTLQLGLESRAKVVPAKPVEPPPKKTSDGFQCMSCVAICEIVGGKQVCPEREDLVCGWGTHPDRKVAAKLAEAECKGALKLSANMQIYGKVEGECPPASCQK